MSQATRREELRVQIRALGTEALSLRDRFADPELKRRADNIATDLGTLELIAPTRDDILETLVNVEALSVQALTRLLTEYPPSGPKLVG